jgi:putative methionine-R-sulfoxide reductase with GAF domain
VIPLVLRGEDGKVVKLGVLDIDCEKLNGFTGEAEDQSSPSNVLQLISLDEDSKGLEGIADLIVKSCDW